VSSRTGKLQTDSGANAARPPGDNRRPAVKAEQRIKTGLIQGLPPYEGRTASLCSPTVPGTGETGTVDEQDSISELYSYIVSR